MNLEDQLDAIQADRRFAVCQQTIGGIFEVSIFYSPLNTDQIDRKEIKQTVCKNKSCTIAYAECFNMFKKWLSANDIKYSFKF